MLLGTAVGAAVLLAPAAALAAGDHVAHQSWARTGTVGVAQPQPGELYVSVLPVQGEQARSFVAFDFRAVDPAAIASQRLVLAPAPDSSVSPVSTPQVQVCPTRTPPQVDGMLPDAGPTPDCALSAELRPQQDGSWAVDLELFAHHLAAGDGLVLLPGSMQPEDAYTLAFAAAQTRLRQTSAAPPVPSPATTPTSTASSGATDGPPAGSSAPPPAFPGSTVVSSPDPRAPEPRTAPLPTTASDTVARPAGVTEGTPVASRLSTAAWLTCAAAIVVIAGVRSRRRARETLTPASPVARTGLVGLLGVAGGGYAMMVVLGSAFSQTTALRIGLVGVSFVAAMGLHVLVNAAGEMSLAHIGNIALPVFLSAQISNHTGLSPVYCLPLAALIGAGVGLVIGLPALRARGLQVAVVTLGGAIAIVNYLFNQSWVVGPPNGLSLPTPTLFGLRLDSYRALLFLIAGVVVLAGLAAHVVLHSRLGRALSLVRANPEAAAAAGIPVNQYRLLAFGIAGTFAGLAGGMYDVLVQIASPASFALTDSFNYLAIAVLAGPGGLAGLAASVLLLIGGQQFLSDINPTLKSVFTYLGPVALIVNLAVYRRGFNGAIRDASALIGRRRPSAPASPRRNTQVNNDVPERRGAPSLTAIAAAVAIVVGGLSIGLAWYHAGNTDQLWVQNQEIVSGGLGGLALVIVGCALLIRDALVGGGSVAVRRAGGGPTASAPEDDGPEPLTGPGGTS